MGLGEMANQVSLMPGDLKISPDSQSSSRAGLGPGLREKFAYGFRVLPGYFRQRLTRRVPRGPVHLMITMANHFEPSIVPEDGMSRVPNDEQERRVDMWCREYPPAKRTSMGRSWLPEYSSMTGSCAGEKYAAFQPDARYILRRLAELHTTRS